MEKAAQLHLHILCHLGLSWLSSSGLSLRHRPLCCSICFSSKSCLDLQQLHET